MDGIICVYKPNGYTSFDVIAIMRRLLNTRKIGHSGTLDPMAEGVLPIFAGAATKAVDFCPDTGKEYRASFKVGITTDTQDISGVIQKEVLCYVPRGRIEEVTKRFTGEIEQLPPMYSAVKINGQRLYNLARKGVTSDEVERDLRKITIHSLELEQYNSDSGEGIIKVGCSKGTYIRTLIHDIGLELGFGAVMTGLQRSMSNGFTLEDCYQLDLLKQVYEKTPDKLETFLKPLQSLFPDYPKAFLDERQTELFRNGAILNADLVRFERVYDGVYSLLDCKERMCALAKIERDHSISVVQRFTYVKI
ncbi:MAG: tRNA pseudouridine(55) synthase TruB [Oscillospiraceae bacterium]|nr:tRNA pseudouridine(55) synthase TruB [Oscillospiraceae bacterium]